MLSTVLGVLGGIALWILGHLVGHLLGDGLSLLVRAPRRFLAVRFATPNARRFVAPLIAFLLLILAGSLVALPNERTANFGLVFAALSLVVLLWISDIWNEAQRAKLPADARPTSSPRRVSGLVRLVALPLGIGLLFWPAIGLFASAGSWTWDGISPIVGSVAIGSLFLYVSVTGSDPFSRMAAALRDVLLRRSRI